MPKSFRQALAEAMGISLDELRGEVQSNEQVGTALEQLGVDAGEGILGDDALAGLLSNTQFMIPGDAGSSAKLGLAQSLEQTLKEAFRLRDIEDERFGEAKQFLQGEFGKLTAGFDDRNERLDRLLFAGAADKFGAEARTGMNRLGVGLGARGIDPRSGAAQSLAGNIALRQQGQLMGAKRDITADSMRRRDANALQRFQAAFGVGDFLNQGASEIGLAALGSLTSARFQEDAREAQLREARLTRRANTKSANIGAIGSAVGAFL